MIDDRSERSAQDRSRISAEDPYEVECFAQKHVMLRKQARDTIQKHGPTREVWDRAPTRQHVEP